MRRPDARRLGKTHPTLSETPPQKVQALRVAGRDIFILEW